MDLYWYTFVLVLHDVTQKPESKLWHLMKENMPDLYLMRFENWVSPGVPDVHGIKDGISFWVELKVITSKKIKLSPHQIMWNYKYSLKGGRSFILAATLSQSLLCVFPGAVVHSIAEQGALAMPSWSFPMSPWPGEQLASLFLHSALPIPPAQS